MTTGNILYLAMSIGMFGLFSAVLAYQCWQQGRQAPDARTVPQAEAHPEPKQSIAA